MQYDLIIVGGGINGAALARLAAFQGMRVGLFEAGDFGQGASSNTSKMIHGGLRYLENFEFTLVRESVRERARLLELAPHLVEARRFLFPQTSLGRHGRWAIKAGMMIYDFLAGRMRLDSHRWLPAEELRLREPHFLTGETCGAYEYSDCLMNDARLILENLLDAKSLGAEIRNYHRFLGSAPAARGGLEVTVLDEIKQKEVVHHCTRLSLALGPWTDQVLRWEFPNAAPQVRLSQGAHLVVGGLASKSCFILPVPGTRRYFFILPWKGKHLIGTTETEVGEELPDPVIPFETETKELLHLLRKYFPDQRPEIICAFAGIRPLARAPGNDTSALSREHQFHRLGAGVFSAVGGKYTTHRVFAARYLKFILGKGRLSKNMKDRPLPGAWRDSGGPKILRARLGKFPFVNNDLAETWIRRYGMRSLELAEYISAYPMRQEKLSGHYHLLFGEVQFSAEREWARTSVDFFRRRTDIYFTRGGGLECLDRVDSAFTDRTPNLHVTLGWDSDYIDFLKKNMHCAAT